jgi:hypothetical protein
VFTRPGAVSDESVLAAVNSRWDFDAVAVDYLAAGFGSHHWIATDADGAKCFLTVDDLAAKEFLGDPAAAAFDALRKAFQLAREIQAQGLEWVVAPLSDIDGGVLRWLDDRYSIAAFPYVEGTSAREYASTQERLDVVELLAELHRSADAVRGSARAETFRLPNRADLEVVMQSLDGRWSAGPYAEPARELLNEHADEVRKSLAIYDRLVTFELQDTSSWTLTHGEPHSRNVLRTSTGLRIIDWDTALLAPTERDLWMLIRPGDGDQVVNHYTERTGRGVSRDLLTLYALWWDLCEVGIYVAEFRSSHDDTEDTRVALGGLQYALRTIAARQL